MHDRIKNPLPIPRQCDNCASFDIAFKNNILLYGRECGEWPYCWHCSSCDAAVGCHSGTDTPLGRMADKKTRKLRAEAHKWFDPLWKSGAMTRSDAYDLVAKHLQINSSECHISQLSIEQLKFVIEQCKDLEISEQATVIKRRKEKKHAKQSKRTQREKHKFHGGKRVAGPNPFFRRARRSEQDSSADS